MLFNVLSGSFGQGSGSISCRQLLLPNPYGWKSVAISFSQVTSAELASAETIKRLGGTLGWGAVGGAILGPVGLFAGLLLGGKKNVYGFAVKLDDGRFFLATGKHEVWLAIKGIALRYDRARIQAAIPRSDSVIETEVLPPPSTDEPLEFIQYVLTQQGWDARREQKVGAERFTTFLASKGRDSLAIAYSPDSVTDYSLDRICSAFDRLDAAARKVIVSRSIGKSVERSANQMAVTVIDLAGLESVIPR